MALVKRKIPLEQLDIASGALKTRQLPLAVLRGICMELDMQIDHAGGATTREDILRTFINKVEIVLNGQDVIQSLPFDFIYYMNKLERGVENIASETLTAGTDRVNNYHAYLPFELGPLAVLPRDTLLDARALSTCVLNLHLSPLAINEVTLVDSASVKLHTVEYANIPEGFSTGRHEFSFDTINLDVAGTITYQLPTRGNNQYRRIWVMTLDGSTPAIKSNAEITNLKVKARSFVYYDAPEDVNRQEQQEIFGIAAEAGIYCIDFTSEGQMAGRVDARNLPELTIELVSAVTDATAVIIAEKAIYAGGVTS